MKKYIGIVLIGLVLIGGAAADPSEAVVTYFTGSVGVASSCTNVGTTGLMVSNAYLCLLVSELASLTEVQATGSLAAVMTEMSQYLNDQIQALAATNRPAWIKLNEQIQYNDAATTQTVYYTYTVQRNASNTFVYPSE